MPLFVTREEERRGAGTRSPVPQAEIGLRRPESSGLDAEMRIQQSIYPQSRGLTKGL